MCLIVGNQDKKIWKLGGRKSSSLCSFSLSTVSLLRIEWASAYRRDVSISHLEDLGSLQALSRSSKRVEKK